MRHLGTGVAAQYPGNPYSDNPYIISDIHADGDDRVCLHIGRVTRDREFKAVQTVKLTMNGRYHLVNSLRTHRFTAPHQPRLASLDITQAFDGRQLEQDQPAEEGAGLIGEVGQSPVGNSTIRTGTALAGTAWIQIAYIVLIPAEREELIELLTNPPSQLPPEHGA